MERSQGRMAEGFGANFFPMEFARIWQQQMVDGIEISQRISQSMLSAIPAYFEGLTGEAGGARSQRGSQSQSQRANGSSRRSAGRNGSGGKTRRRARSR